MKLLDELDEAFNAAVVARKEFADADAAVALLRSTLGVDAASSELPRPPEGCTVDALDKKVKAAADAQKRLEVAELPRPPEGSTVEAPGPRCGQPCRTMVGPNVEEENAWPSLPRPPEAAGSTKRPRQRARQR